MKTKRIQSRIILGAILLILFFQDAFPCTGFLIRNGNHLTVCFNFDFQFGNGQIYINKRNTKRQRFLLYSEKPIQWTSKYGSITFNLISRDWPHDGINETGLVVLSMGLDDTQFQDPDNRFPIDENGWVQYQLDNCASIDDVLKNMKRLRISKRSIGDSHFLIVDSTGNALIVEYIYGQEKIYTGDTLPFAVLANDTYSRMLDYLNQQKPFGGLKEDTFRVSSSCCRFARVADRTRHIAPSNDSLYAFGLDLLNEMKQSNTQYQVAYDITEKVVYYRSRTTDRIKSISLNETDFDCSTPVLMTNIQSTERGDIRKAFYPYNSSQSKLTLVEFNKHTFEYFPDEALACFAEISTNSNCQNEAPHSLTSTEKRENENIMQANPIVATLHRPKEDSIVITNDQINTYLNFEVELNQPAEQNMDFALIVPDSSGLSPAKNVFITPNPVRIEKGRTSAKVMAIIIPGHIKKGTNKYLIVDLLSDEVKLGDEKQFRIKVRNDAKQQ